MFPLELINMDSLVYINLFHNDIDSLDFKDGDLPSLKNINLCYNRFETFPIELANLANLKRVSIWYCKISEIPYGIEELQQLEYLNLRGNPLTEESKLKVKDALPNTKLEF